jgi:hypothetical protein|tara:strand:+ start:7212 stop:9212 length:2001 start_codon:yes stop_codon:yes gene_type:complete
MSKISNQSAYPAAAPALDDYLIGTDVSDSNATKTFTLGDITGLTPADTLEEVLTAGNTATNNIILTGDVSCTNAILTGDISCVNATLTGDVSCTNLTATTTITGTTINGTSITGTVVVGNTSVTTPLVRPTNIEDSAGSTGTAGQYLRFQPGGIVWETVVPAIPNLSDVLTSGNTATNNIVLTGNISCTNLTATQDVNGDVFNATTQVSTALLDATDIQDGAGDTGTAGQYLTATGTGLLWQTVSPTAIPLADVLAAGNTATNDINLTGVIDVVGTITAGAIALHEPSGSINGTSLSVGEIYDDIGSAGTANQVLAKNSFSNLLEWKAVSGSVLPLNQYKYFVGDASNQASESTLLTETAGGRVNATKFTTPDFECVGVGSTFVQEGMNPVGTNNLSLGEDNLITVNHSNTLILGHGNNALNVGGATDSVILGQGNLAAITGSVEDNYIIGQEVLQTETTSSLSNIAIGKQVMTFTTGAPNSNVVIGNLAVSTGAGTGGVEENVIVGAGSALGIATLNQKNVVLGFSALGEVTGTARDNVVIGSNALEGGTSKTSLTGSIVIGTAADTGATTAINNAIVVSSGPVNLPYGPTQTGVQDNETFIGNANTTYAQIEGRINFPLVGASGGGFQDDAAAGAAGLTRGDVYMTNGTGTGPLAVAGILMIKQ